MTDIEEEQENNNQNLKREIRRNYLSGTHPISFSGRSNVKRYYPQASQSLINDALAGLDTYTIFREEKKPRVYNPIYVREPRELIQSDLIDLHTIANKNRNVKYLLVVIDSFTRFAWVRPLLSKNTDAVLSAFKDIVRNMPGGIGKAFMSDQGTEYVNRVFRNYLTENGVEIRIPNNKCPHVERFNRTLQNLLFRYMEENETETYIDKLQQLVSVYNNRYHRTIKMSPKEAERPENLNKVENAVQEYYDKVQEKAGTKKNQKFKVGDHVRITLYKQQFHKGYYQTFKRTVYEISEVLTNLPVTMYKLKNLDTGQPEVGTWYNEELQKVSKDYDDTVFKIEREVRTRGRGPNKQVLVKWKNYPESFNSWEPYENIQAIRRRNLRGNE